MGRRLPFSQADVERAFKAALACGLAVLRTEIARDGRIVMVHHPDALSEPVNELDRELDRFEASKVGGHHGHG